MVGLEGSVVALGSVIVGEALGGSVYVPLWHHTQYLAPQPNWAEKVDQLPHELKLNSTYVRL